MWSSLMIWSMFYVCKSPYDSEFMASSEQRATSGRPYGGSGEVVVPQNRCALCGGTFDLGEVGGADFMLRYGFCFKAQLLRAFFTLICTAWSAYAD